MRRKVGLGCERRSSHAMLGTLCCLVALGSWSAAAGEQDRVTLRIRFGMQDKEPTDWSGKLLAGSGKVEAIRGWRWMQDDSAKGNTWSVKTRRGTPQSAADRNRIAAGLALPMTDNGNLE